jgi:hypothetical protein
MHPREECSLPTHLFLPFLYEKKHYPSPGDAGRLKAQGKRKPLGEKLKGIQREQKPTVQKNQTGNSFIALFYEL